ncbi:MAG: ATP synthase F1 subunit delta [Bacteroidota bacterium]
MKNEIVHRYVDAFFRFVKKHADAKKVQEDLKRFVASCTQHPHLLAFLRNKLIPSAKKIHMIGVLAPKMQKATHYFFSLVIRGKREAFLRQMAIAFIEAYKKSAHMCIVKVDAARPIPPANMEKIKALVAQLTPCQQVVEIDVRILPQLIGGYVLHIGPHRLDATIKARLNQLQKVWLA